jgi:hypothetical protein
MRRVRPKDWVVIESDLPQVSEPDSPQLLALIAECSPDRDSEGNLSANDILLSKLAMPEITL